MKFRVAVLLLLYKCLVFAPNIIFATESAVSGLTCPLKTCTDVLKELGATEKQLKDLEIRLAKSENQTEEIKKEKQAQIEEIKKEKQDLEIRLAKSEAQIEEIKKEKQDLEIRLAKSEAQTEEIKKENQDIVSWTRNDFLQYSRRITLDLNTVSKYIRLSESNTVITGTYPELQSYPHHPDRFDLPQVLCSESVSDQRSYWEIEWRGDNVEISVSYKSISRKGWGNECSFGTNDQSWILMCYSSSYSFRHNKIDTKLPVKPIISRTGDYGKNYYRTGVYVDHSAGTLSFYSVSGDTMSLIHTVQTTFSQPLYPGFRVYYGSSVKLI
ncbi:stonustoxin subunit alpha-like isoform X2 [Megalobrama amblycephala]|uniref:stonustoxin subunit alpha-like isoform X2 n=1 Tax=Megalobrama amblycephala TaxID=75352 RepID=UPI0020147CC2|nr:stonustoxin subunit alpha-like isoform X2 [Megalobrama amblycephala]